VEVEEKEREPPDAALLAVAPAGEVAKAELAATEEDCP
jgi:hypothetical protein